MKKPASEGAGFARWCPYCLIYKRTLLHRTWDDEATKETMALTSDHRRNHA